MPENTITIQAKNLVHIRPTANDNIPHRKYGQIAIKNFDHVRSKNPKPQPNFETNWKQSKLRLQWLND